MKMFIYNIILFYCLNILLFRFYKLYIDFIIFGVCLYNFQCFLGIKIMYWENGKVVILYI